MKEFEKTYRELMEAVFRYALHMVRDRALAEDITSETFLALYRNREQVDDDHAQSWLFSVAKNRACDHWRHMATEQRYAENWMNENIPDSDEHDLENWILESKALKPVHRTCLILRYVYGMTRVEIAKQTGLENFQIKSALQYALKLLRKEFSDGAYEKYTL
jgi:RNA polymerase sigma-70 factor, ECF subfamily